MNRVSRNKQNLHINQAYKKRTERFGFFNKEIL